MYMHVLADNISFKKKFVFYVGFFVNPSHHSTMYFFEQLGHLYAILHETFGITLYCF